MHDEEGWKRSYFFSSCPGVSWRDTGRPWRDGRLVLRSSHSDFSKGRRVWCRRVRRQYGVERPLKTGPGNGRTESDPDAPSRPLSIIIYRPRRRRSSLLSVGGDPTGFRNAVIIIIIVFFFFRDLGKINISGAPRVQGRYERPRFLASPSAAAARLRTVRISFVRVPTRPMTLTGFRYLRARFVITTPETCHRQVAFTVVDNAPVLRLAFGPSLFDFVGACLCGNRRVYDAVDPINLEVLQRTPWNGSSNESPGTRTAILQRLGQAGEKVHQTRQER